MTRQRGSIILVEQFFWPDGWGGAQLPRDLSVALARQGWKVRVFCGSDQYVNIDGAAGEDPRAAGVCIRRAPRLFGGDIHRLKLFRQLWFYVAAVPMLFWGRAPDIYVVQTNPPLIVPIVALVARLRRRPYVIIAQDIYPEVMFAHGMSRSDGLPGKLLARLFSWAYRNAVRIVSLGEVMKKRLAHKGVQPGRTQVVSNWATGDMSIERGSRNSLRDKWGLTGCFVILYSGNLGIAHDVETPIAALKMLLAQSPRVRLVFIGKGSRLADARRAAEEAQVAHAVQFRPLVPADQLPQTLGLAEVALVTLREGFEGLVVPSKVLGYMARGIPTLYVGPHSDVEQMLSESGGGVCLRNGDAQGVCRELQALMARPDRLTALGDAAHQYYQTELSQQKGLQKYADLLDTVIAESARAR
jgi:colanic acid biosynthesis glycosyl transferase WcaI